MFSWGRGFIAGTIDDLIIMVWASSRFWKSHCLRGQLSSYDEMTVPALGKFQFIAMGYLLLFGKGMSSWDGL